MIEDVSICEVRRLGLVPYTQAWELQNQLAGKVASGECPPTLLLLEHHHTYTLGRRGEAQHLLWKPEELEERGVTVEWVDRGGDITYHGPGQLVGYPILPLAGRSWLGERLPQADYVGYVRKLEITLISALMKFGLAAGQIPGLTGVWIQPDVASRCPRCDPRLRQAPSKIASIGIKVDVHGISRHGFALNVSPDMTYWQGIVPCGLDGVMMASFADLLEPVPEMTDVIGAVIDAFHTVFRYKMVEVNQMV
ncbi:MAG: lipoyl(octanoyl) transferase LipB [Anaerolineaceae bacterium]|nr:lipoyl(octanoyl) transferase LipB [Anaerolineaceae bacterium]